jgi:tetratricopeptide repeat protein 30
MKQFGPAMKHVADIIEKGVREHPELSVGSTTEGIDVRSVGNSVVLKQTALIEAFNLKAAIEYVMRNFTASKEALTGLYMCPHTYAGVCRHMQTYAEISPHPMRRSQVYI